jgi:hypothetical protein
MRRSTACLIALSLLILSSCAKQQGEEYFPKVSAGSQWEYVLQYATPAGTQNGKLLIRIAGEEKVNGKKYYKQISIISGLSGQETQTSYNRRGKDGIYKIDNIEKDNLEYKSIPFPLTVGSVWTITTPDGQLKYRAEKVETVEMLNRRYENCLRISYQVDNKGVHVEGVTHLAPGIGEVACVQKMGENEVTYVLDRYNL